MPSPRSGVVAVLVCLGACERADQTATSEPPAVAPPAPLAPPRQQLEPPKPAVSIAPPPVDHRELPPPPKTWFTRLSSGKRRDVREVCRLKVADPCNGLLPKPRVADRSPPPPDRIATLLDRFPGEERERVTAFCQRNYPTGGCDTPLVLAFEAEPIDLTPATTAAFAFTPGAPAVTDWPTGRTPWLAIDRDGDGAIRTGAELFGDATRLADGTTATNGFAALAELDANRDGVIDRRDPAFASLVVWADHDGDHASSADELTPLADVVIAIPVSSRVVPRCDDRGNCEGERSPMTWRDPTGAVRTGAVVDLYLRRR